VSDMRLDGIHHITAITGDAPGNLDFYARVLGLRLVKKTVNQDEPTVYHLFYGDEQGRPGMDLTFFEYRGAPRGRAGAGMVHRILWRVGSPEALDFWAERLGDEGSPVQREESLGLRISDPEGLEHELIVDHSGDAALLARHPEIEPRLALRGFAGVRAFLADPARSAPLLQEGLGFVPRDAGWEVRGVHRGGLYLHDEPPAQRGLQGAGTVHHVAFTATIAEQPAWRERVLAAGGHPTRIIDRFYFHSVYLREPGGVLMEIATDGPGFAADEPLARIGRALALPPIFEPARERIEAVLPVLPDPQPWREQRSDI
jgi:glyoxalase family protein